MAYCPHCGKRNSEQATACVSCGEPLEPKKKAGASRFKGTVMMGGTRPEGGPPKNTPPSQPPEPKPKGGRGFKKTMLGPAAAAPPAGGDASKHQPPYRANTAQSSDARSGPTGTAPWLDAPRPEGTTGFDPTLPAPPGEAFDPTLPAPPSEAFEPQGALRDEPPSPKLDSSDLGGPAAFPGEDGIPGARNPRALLYMGAGCLAALVLVAVVTAVVCSGPVLAFLGLADDATTAAKGVVMRGTAVMTLQRVRAACASGHCDAAADAFHPKVREALLPNADALNEAILERLSDLQRAHAEPLDETDDAHLAEELGIPPEQCARLTGGEVKVVTCGSEEGPTRIIHLEGLNAS